MTSRTQVSRQGFQVTGALWAGIMESPGGYRIPYDHKEGIKCAEQAALEWC